MSRNVEFSVAYSHIICAIFFDGILITGLLLWLLGIERLDIIQA